jgi:hypothetical protein
MRSTFQTINIEEKTMITHTHTKTEEHNEVAELRAEVLQSTVEAIARGAERAEMAAAEANNASAAAKGAAAKAQAMFEGCGAEVARENRISMAGGIGGLVGSAVGVTAAIVVARKMGLDNNATVSLAGGSAFVGGTVGGLGGVGVNALLEMRKNKK